MSIPTKSLEFLMESWRSHSKTGFHLTFLVAPGDEEFFKAIPDGTRFQAVLVRLTDQETPAPLPTEADAKRQEAKRLKNATAEAEGKSPLAVTEETAQARTLPLPLPLPSQAKFPTGLCGLAVRWCGDPHFRTG